MILRKNGLVYFRCPHSGPEAGIGDGHVVFHWLAEYNEEANQSNLYITNVFVNHSSTRGTFNLRSTVRVEDEWSFSFDNTVELQEANASEPAQLSFVYGSIVFPTDYIPIGTFTHSDGKLIWTTKNGVEKTTIGTTVRLSFDAALSGGEAGFNGASTAQTVSIDLTLPDATRVRVNSDMYIDESYTLILDKYSNSYSHSIRYEFCNLSGYFAGSGYIVDTEQKMSGETSIVRIPTDFYAQIPNSVGDICNFIISTYSTDESGVETLISETVFQTTVSVLSSRAAPILEVSAKDINEATLSLTGDSSTLIRYASNLDFTIESSARHSATIVSTTINGIEVSSDSFTEEGASSSQYKVVVTDSRGLTASKTLTFDIIPYIPLTNMASAKRVSPTSNEVLLTAVGNYYDGEFNSVPNELNITYYVSGGFPVPDGEDGETYIDTKSDTIIPVLVTGGYNGGLTLSDLLYTQEYTIEVVVQDKLSTISKTIKIGQGIPVFDWGKNDFTVNKTFIAKGNAAISGSLILKDLESIAFATSDDDDVSTEEPTVTLKSIILDITHPVGSLYMSLDCTNPSDLFGGTWESIKDTFILAAGDTYEAGTVGGSSTHTQTLEEMAYHYHGMYVYEEDGSIPNITGTEVVTSRPYIGAITHDSITYNYEKGVPNTVEVGMTAFKGGAPVTNDDGETSVETQPMDIMPPYLVAYIWKRIA